MQKSSELKKVMMCPRNEEELRFSTVQRTGEGTLSVGRQAVLRLRVASHNVDHLAFALFGADLANHHYPCTHPVPCP